jgi:hypothetical protein
MVISVQLLKNEYSPAPYTRISCELDTRRPYPESVTTGSFQAEEGAKPELEAGGIGW